MRKKQSTAIIATFTLLVGLLTGAAIAGLHERQKGESIASYLHAEMAIACRTYPQVQAGARSMCKIIPVMENMEMMAIRTGKPTILWEDIQAAKKAESDFGLAEVQAKIDAMNAERDAYVEECMAEAIAAIDKANSNPELAKYDLFSQVGNQQVNVCRDRYAREQQDKRLRERYEQ